jgi:hypothetical protein
MDHMCKREIPMEMWKKIRIVEKYALTDPFYNIRHTILRIGETYGLSEQDLIESGVIAALSE